MTARNYTPQVSLNEMDKFGTETAVLSLTVAAEYLYDGTDKAIKFAREANDYGAKAVQMNPKRFGLLASLPAKSVDATLKEIEYAFDTLKCDGVSLFTNTGDKWWGDPMFLPMFDELNRRKSPVFFHPTVANCCHNLAGVGDGVVEFDFDTTRTVVSLLFNGVLSRCQDIKWIINHSGAAIPTLAGRIKDRVPEAGSSKNGKFNPDAGTSPKVPKGAYYELKRLYLSALTQLTRCPWRRCGRSLRQRSSCSARITRLSRRNRRSSSSRISSCLPMFSTRSTAATPSACGRDSKRRNIAGAHYRYLRSSAEKLFELPAPIRNSRAIPWRSTIKLSGRLSMPVMFWPSSASDT